MFTFENGFKAGTRGREQIQTHAFPLVVSKPMPVGPPSWERKARLSLLCLRYWSSSCHVSLLQWGKCYLFIIFYSSTSNDICKSKWVSGGFNLLFYRFFLFCQSWIFTILILLRCSLQRWVRRNELVPSAPCPCTLLGPVTANEPHVRELIFRSTRDVPRLNGKVRGLCRAGKSPSEDGGAV